MDLSLKGRGYISQSFYIDIDSFFEILVGWKCSKKMIQSSKKHRRASGFRLSLSHISQDALERGFTKVGRTMKVVRFFDHEQRSKVLKEALLLLFLFMFLPWNYEWKMFQLEQKLCKGTKNVQGNKKCAQEQRMFILVKMKLIRIHTFYSTCIGWNI